MKLAYEVVLRCTRITKDGGALLLLLLLSFCRVRRAHRSSSLFLLFLKTFDSSPSLFFFFPDFLDQQRNAYVIAYCTSTVGDAFLRPLRID